MKRTLLLAAAVPLLVLVGGGGAVASAAPTLAPMTDPDPSDDPEERIRQFTQCLRDNGIDLPDPTEAHGPVHFEIGPDGREEFEDALEACEAFAPSHGRTAEIGPEQREEMEKFHECLSDHGVDLPEAGVGIVVSRHAEAGVAAGPMPHHPTPPPGEAHHLTPLPGSEEAVEACKDLLPGDGDIIVGTGDGGVAAGHAHPAGIGISIAVDDGEG